MSSTHSCHLPDIATRLSTSQPCIRGIGTSRIGESPIAGPRWWGEVEGLSRRETRPSGRSWGHVPTRGGSLVLAIAAAGDGGYRGSDDQAAVLAAHDGSSGDGAQPAPLWAGSIT